MWIILLVLLSIWRARAQSPPVPPLGGEYDDKAPDGSYRFGFQTGDLGAHYRAEVASKDNQLVGRFGSRDPSKGQVVETQYTAGKRGFRARGPNIARQMDLSQNKIPYNPPVRPDSPNYRPTLEGYHDPNESPAYKFGFRTPTYTKNENQDSRGHVEGVYSYVDDIGERHDVRYEAGPKIGFLVKTAFPDSKPFTGLFYKGPPGKGGTKPRGRSSIQQRLDGSYQFLASAPDHRRFEISDRRGNVQGSYTYVDDKGLQRTVQYIAGPNIGYKVIRKGVGAGFPPSPPFVPPSTFFPPFSPTLEGFDGIDSPPGAPGRPTTPPTPIFPPIGGGPEGSLFGTTGTDSLSLGGSKPPSGGGDLSGDGLFGSGGGGSGGGSNSNPFGDSGGNNPFGSPGSNPFGGTSNNPFGGGGTTIGSTTPSYPGAGGGVGGGGGSATGFGDGLFGGGTTSTDGLFGSNPTSTPYPQEYPSTGGFPGDTTFPGTSTPSYPTQTFPDYSGGTTKPGGGGGSTEPFLGYPKEKPPGGGISLIPGDLPNNCCKPGGPTTTSRPPTTFGSSSGFGDLFQPSSSFSNDVPAPFGQSKPPAYQPEDDFLSKPFSSFPGRSEETRPPRPPPPNDDRYEENDNSFLSSNKNFFGFPAGEPVRAHVQSLDIIPFGARLPSPGEALERDLSRDRVRK